jgi:hypothetical protein
MGKAGLVFQIAEQGHAFTRRSLYARKRDQQDYRGCECCYFALTHTLFLAILFVASASFAEIASSRIAISISFFQLQLPWSLRALGSAGAPPEDRLRETIPMEKF